MFDQERALIVLDVFEKCGVQQKSSSLDTGPFVTPKRLFRLVLEKFPLDFVHVSSRKGSYRP